MQQRFSQEKEKPTIPAQPPTSNKRLMGKVILIIGGLKGDCTGNGRTLAEDLAAQGADIALVYDRGKLAQAGETQKAVQAQGQTCLLIPLSVHATPYKIVRYILKELGSLDVFLDFTEDNGFYPHKASPWSATRLPLLVAAMKHMVLKPDEAAEKNI